MKSKEWEFDVAIVGLGFVGLTLAVAFAEKGLRVLGIEKDIEIFDQINHCKPHFFEPELESKLRSCTKSKNFKLESNLLNCSESANIVITVGTPWTGSEVDQSAIFSIANELTSILSSDSNLIIRSTVSIGTTSLIEDIFESKKCFASISMCPERTLEGSALEELRSLPQIIGSRSEEGRIRSTALFNKLTNDLVILQNSKEAELAKLICNSFRDLKFAFANEIAILGDAYGVSAKSAIKAANHNYSRAGIPLPGPVAGPCLEKDGHILAESILKNVDSSLAKIARQVNESLPDWVVSQVMSSTEVDDSKIVGLLGIAFKGQPVTSDVRGSMAISITRLVTSKFPNLMIQAWDPTANKNHALKYGLNWSELEEILNSASLIIIQNNNPYFSSDEFFKRIRSSRAEVIIDLWGIKGLKESCPDKRIIEFGD